MTTRGRGKNPIPYNAAHWIDECLDEHDPDTQADLRKIVTWIEREREDAKNKFDKPKQGRLLELATVVLRMQDRQYRVNECHRKARQNEPYESTLEPEDEQ